MSGLFGRKRDYPDPKEPATMPDEFDEASIRAKREAERKIRSGSSSETNRLAPVPGTIGREYSRGTLGG